MTTPRFLSIGFIVTLSTMHYSPNSMADEHYKFKLLSECRSYDYERMRIADDNGFYLESRLASALSSADRLIEICEKKTLTGQHQYNDGYGAAKNDLLVLRLQILSAYPSFEKAMKPLIQPTAIPGSRTQLRPYLESIGAKKKCIEQVREKYDSISRKNLEFEKRAPQIEHCLRGPNAGAPCLNQAELKELGDLRKKSICDPRQVSPNCLTVEEEKKISDFESKLKSQPGVCSRS